MTSYIGVDVGKKSIQVYLPIIDKSFELTNNDEGFAKMTSYLSQHYKSLSTIIITFEPTGGYERNLREYLKSNQINFATVHPNKVRNYAKARGWLAKTDYIDSKLLSDYATTFSLEIKQDYCCQVSQKLHSLIQRRGQLVYFKTQDSNRLETEHDRFILESINAHLIHVEEQLKEIEVQIKQLCDHDEELKNKFAKLTSIPGVGIVIATTAICELPELGNIEFNKLTALVGLAPYARESGSYKGNRRIFAGRGNLRKMLYMGAVASLRSNEKLKAFYDRLIDNHKPAKVALVAVMRKLLGFMHAVIKNNTCWTI